MTDNNVSEDLKIEFGHLAPVQVVKVTQNNFEAVAKWCGGTVHETPSRRRKNEMDKYVLVPTPKSNDVSWAFPGMFVTKRLVITMKGELKATWAVFRRDYYEKNYFDSVKSAVDATWEREHDERLKPKEEVVVTVHVGEAMEDALEKIKQIAAKSGAQVNINVTQDQPFSHKEGEQITQVEGTEITPEKTSKEAIADGSEVIQFKHEHLSDEKCDEADCEVDRYLDGLHIFTDVTIMARPGQENEVFTNEPVATS